MSRTFGSSLQLHHFSLQRYSFKQFVDTFTGMRRHLDELGFSTPVFRYDFNRRKLVFDSLWVCTLLVNLVNCNNQRDSRCLGVRYSLFCLWHNTIIGSNYENYYISHLCSASSHCSKSGVTGCIQKSNLALPSLNPVGTNMLRNATGFARGNLGFT